MMIWLRALLALGMLVGLYVLTVVLVLVDLAFIVGVIVNFFLSWGASYNQFPSQVLLMLFASIPTTGAVLYGIFAVSHGIGGVRPDSVIARHGDAPVLWEMIIELADQVGTRPPTELRLVPAAVAEVEEETRLLGLVGGIRRMYIGLPYLVGMSVAELRAVLGHELGHYAHRHTRIGAIAYRGRAALLQTLTRLERVERASWYLWLFIPYARLYFWISAAVARRQEHEADAAAAQIVGTAVTTEALRSAHLLPAIWDEFLIRYIEPMRKAGWLPDDPFRVFQAMLHDADVQRLLVDLRQSPPQPPRTPFDSHPSLAQRLRMLDRSRKPSNHRSGQDQRTAIELLGNGDSATTGEPAELIESVRRVMFPRRNRPASLPWRQWMDQAAELLAVAQAKRLIHAAHIHDRGLPDTPLAAVMDLLERPEGQRLAATLTRLPPNSATSTGDPEDQARAQLHDALFALIGHALVTAGQARWQLSWTGPSRLNSTIAMEEVQKLVTAALSEQTTDIKHVRNYLDSLGVDSPALLGPDPKSTPPTTRVDDPAVHSATAEESAQRRRRLAMAMSVGVITIVLMVAEECAPERAVDLPRSVHTPGLPNPYNQPNYPPLPNPPPPIQPSYRPLPNPLPSIQLPPNPQLKVSLPEPTE
jgi:Zn-dependent protease with chaperone function